MADFVSPVQRPRSSHEALLQLEKGTASPATQLNEAAQIIGLDFALCASHPEALRSSTIRENPAPKEEWVLRWLLKKLKAGEAYRADPASFLLLRQLIDRIPPKTLAATLSDHKFLSILSVVITEVANGVVRAFENTSSDLHLSGSESSHTLGRSPTIPQDADRKGRKRKRTSDDEDEDAVMDLSQQQPPTLTSYLLTFMRILDCLYGLVSLVNKAQGDHAIASSHLKHTLRGEPESIAKILGKSFKMGAIAAVEFSDAQRVTDLQHLFYVLPAVLELWELRSSRQDDSENKSSNEAFATYCFPQALRLHLNVRSTTLDSDERAQLLHGLERLIALHVVLPARADFFAKGGSGIDYSADEPDWSSVKPVSATFRPYLREKDVDELDSSEQAKEREPSVTSEGSQNKSGLRKTAELLPTFLDIAVRSVPRDTFRRQTSEAPWLETLFVSIAELAFSAIKEEDESNVTPEFVPILEQMFRVVLDRGVHLSLHTLLTHAGYTGLFKDDLKLVRWSLTALVMKLGVDIFLPNSGLPDSRRLLNALLEKIMAHWTSGASAGEETYEVIKTGIVLPLARGFAAARDLLTFVQIWYEQLMAVETARSKSDNLAHFSVWEDDDLAACYNDLIRNSLTDAQLLAQVQTAANEIKAEGGEISGSAQAYARFVILEAGSTSGMRAESSDNPRSVYKSVIETLTLSLASKQKLHWRWRLWRFARFICETSVKLADSPLSSGVTNLVKEAASNIQRLHKSSSKSQRDYLEILEAYRFVLAVVGKSIESQYVEQLDSLTADIAPFLKAVLKTEKNSLIVSPWDGRAESVDSPVALATAYLVTVLRAPEVWSKIKSESRRPLFDGMFSLAVAQHNLLPSSTLDNPPSNARFVQLWAGLVSHEYLLNVPCIANDILAVLCDRVKNDASTRKLSVPSLQRIPAGLVSRHQRGILLDLLQEIILQRSIPVELSAEMLALMAKLADMPKSPALVTSDWEVVWKLAAAVSLQGTDLDLQVMKSFRNLHRAVIAKFLVASEEDKQKLFKKTYRRISSMVSKLKSIEYNSLEAFLLRISLSQFWSHRAQLPSVFDEAELDSHRQKVFKLLVSDLQSFKKEMRKGALKNSRSISLIKNLDALEDFEDLAQDNENIEKCLTEIEESVAESSVDSGLSLQRMIRRRVLAARGPGKNITSPVMQCAEVFPLQQLYGEEQQLFIKETTERFRSMTAEELLRVVSDIRETGFVGDGASYRLLVAGLAIASLTPVEDKECAQSKELSSLCTAVTESLPKSTSIEQFSLAAECLDIQLRNHPRSITQWNVDSLLASVAVCASSSGPHISSQFAGMIYIRLCRLMGVLFGLYRQKLGGRFHLIVPALQRLLTCLFAPAKKRHKRSTRTTSHQDQPHWLAPLNASHAVHFTRLLTSLCDPTVSAVAKPMHSGPGHEALTDQTKKAKRVAGQYLQYLIMEYAQCSLRGALAPEVKAALLPGLYAALDVMSRETMRALNAGLDVSGRAVFKGLYDDYVKFGKWNKG